MPVRSLLLGVHADDPEAHRHVTRRDGREEGEPEVEPSTEESSAAEVAMKDAQRDLTSLSGPVYRQTSRRRGPDSEAPHADRDD